MPSRWISVAPEEHHDETGTTLLDQRDVDAITAQVPTISVAIAERIRAGTLITDRGEADAEICGTVPDYLAAHALRVKQ